MTLSSGTQKSLSIHLIKCTYKSLENYVTVAFHIDAPGRKFDLAEKRSRSDKCYNFNKLDKKSVSKAIYDVQRSSIFWS